MAVKQVVIGAGFMGPIRAVLIPANAFAPSEVKRTITPALRVLKPVMQTGEAEQVLKALRSISQTPGLQRLHEPSLLWAQYLEGVLSGEQSAAAPPAAQSH